MTPNYYAYTIQINGDQTYQMVLDKTARFIPVITDKNLAERAIERVFLNQNPPRRKAMHILDITSLVENGIVSLDRLRSWLKKLDSVIKNAKIMISL